MDEISEVRKRIDEAVRFRDSDQRKEAATAFALIIRQFSASKEPAVRERVAEALVNLGVMVRSSGDPTTAISIFDRVIVEYQAATAFLICALFNKGGALMAWDARRMPLAPTKSCCPPPIPMRVTIRLFLNASRELC
jgi:hypothetical protein